MIATQTSEQDIQQVLLEYGATPTPMVSHSQLCTYVRICSYINFLFVLCFKIIKITLLCVQAPSASLMEASNTGNVEMAYSLLDSGADPNLANEVSTVFLKIFCHNLFLTGWMDCTIGSSK